MKKTVGVLSLVVMLLSQVFTSFVYAVSGDELPLSEPVVEEIVSEPEVVEPVVIPEVDNSTGDNNFEVEEISTGEIVDIVEPVDVEVNTGVVISTGEETKNLEEEEVLTGTEASSGFIEKITESIKNFLGINGEEDEEKFESHEIYGTRKYEGVKVEVYAQTGLFASGTELTIEPVVDEKLEAVQEVLLSGEVDFVEEQVIAFDITFINPETQEELQPKDGTVQVKFNYEENESLVQAEEDEEQEVKIYHLNDIDEEGNKIEELTLTKVEEAIVNEEESEEENMIVVEAEKFSVYTIVKQVREEQLINFEFGMISIAKPNSITDSSKPAGYTIMDRNLGATSVGGGKGAPQSSFGYHYQWGNNYGFDSNKKLSELNISTSCINVSGLEEYNSNKYVKGKEKWMCSPLNTNLWGESGQGPCPNGWHIPSKSEWQNLYDYYKGTYNGDYLGFSDHFKIPFAGLRSYTWNPVGEVIHYNDRAYYMTSSLRYDGTLVMNMEYSFSSNMNGYFGNAYSVRCFKDTYEGIDSNFHTITYNYGVSKGNTLQIKIKRGGKLQKPEDPIYDDAEFVGRYLKGTDDEFDFDNSVINNDIELYAKLNCGQGFEFNGTKCQRIKNGEYAKLVDGNTFNETIKSLVNGNLSSIQKIVNSNENNLNSVLISDENTEDPIYMWFEDGNLYYYTKAGTIFFNEDSSKMFKGFSNLKKINIEGWDTSKVTDMNQMFNGCSSLTNLDVSEWDTNKVTDMNQMFNGCSSLTNLDVSNFVTSNVTDMSHMFYGCSSLTSLDLSGWGTNKVTDMNQMFNGCSSLTNLDVSEWDTSKVTDMNQMFNGCSSLTNLDVSGWNTSKVTDMNQMFNGCSSLTNLDVSNFVTSNVTDMSHMFYGCSSLTSLDLSGWGTSKVTDMSFMFGNCNKLISLDVSEWNISNVTTLQGIFSDCYLLANLDVSRWKTNKATNMSQVFKNCRRLTGLDLSGWDTSKVTDMNQMFNDNMRLKSLDVSNFDTKNVTDMGYMFYGCKELTSLDVGNFNTSKVTNMSSMFYDCKKLTSLDVSNFDTRNITNMSSMFFGIGLESLNLNGFNTSKVTDMSHMFQSSSLETLNIDMFDTTNVKDMSYMFYNCKELKSLDVSNFDTKNVTSMSDMFHGCSSLTSLDVSNFNTSNVTSMSSMFDNCSKLTELDLYNWDTSNVSYIPYMFQSDSNIEKIYVGSKFRLKDGISSYSMFNGLTKIKGGYGTTFNPNKTNAEYARIDNEYHSGYFTKTGSNNDIIAYLLPGSSFNKAVKSIAKNSTITSVTSYTMPDTSVTGFQRSTTLKDGVTTIISTSNSEVPIYAWLDNGIIKYYAPNNAKIEIDSDLSYMFYNFQSLSSLDLSGWDTSNVTNMSYMFYGCSSLSSINVSGWNTNNVTNMYQMFYGCSSLSSLNLSNWKVSKAWGYMTEMFNGCNSLTNLILDGWDLSEENNSSSVMRGCPIQRISMQGWKISKDFSYGIQYFLSSSNVQEIDVSNWDLSETEDIHNLFSSTSLRRIIGIKTWTGTNVKLKNMSYLFKESNYLTGIDMSNMNLSKVTNINQMFQSLPYIKRINMSNVNFESLKNMKYFCQSCSNLEEVDLSNWNVNITEYNDNNSDSLFMSVPHLKNVKMSNFGKIPSTFGMFEFNYDLTGLDLVGLDTSETTNMNYMFGYSPKLETIYVTDKFNTGKVETSIDMFNGVVSLVGGNGTKYDPNNVDVTYARIDNEYHPGYFTDPRHFAVKYLTTTGFELEKKWISTGSTVEELEDTHRNYRYYTSGDLKTGFNFNEPINKYTEIYVTWDDVHYVTYEYGIGVEGGTVFSGNCVEENGEDRLERSTGCEIVLPKLKMITGYNMPLWYDEGEDVSYEDKIILTGDKKLEARAQANHYLIIFNPGTGTGEMESQEIEYNKEENLNKNKYIKDGYHFSGWIDALGKEYRDGEKLFNLLTQGILELTAQWLQNPPAAGGGQSLTPTINEQEHNVVEEKQEQEEQKEQKEQKQEENELIDQVEKEIEVEQVPIKTNNSSTQTTTQTTSIKELTEEEREIQSAYVWAYEHNITTIPSFNDSDPDGVVTRGHLAKMVVNYATNVLGREIPEKIPSYCRWNDWKTDRESEEIKDYAVKSCALGLMGLDMPKFLPNMEVTRAQFGTIMSRLLWGKKYAGGTPYYRKHLNALKENNIMTQIENPERRVELRQWVWLMLMRSAENK